MSDRITTTCQHTHTVTLRLDEGEWRAHNGRWIRAARMTRGRVPELLAPNWDDWWVPIGAWPAESEPRGLRAELEAALAATEAVCRGCGPNGRCVLMLPAIETDFEWEDDE